MNYSDNKRLAHVTEGEVVIPREVAALRPELVAHVGQQLRLMGGDPQRLQVGKGYVNPRTGQEEFATREEVTAAYRQILGRDPDAEGLKYWMNPANGFSLGNFAVGAASELRNNATKYQNDLNALQKQYGNLNTQVSTLQNQQKDWENKYGALNNQYSNLQNQFGSLQNYYGSMEQQMAEREKQYGILQNTYNATQQDLANQQMKYGSLQDQYNMLNNQYGAVQNQYGTLTNEFGNLKNQYGGLQNQYSTLTDEFGNLKNQYGTIEQQLAERQKQYDALGKEYAQIQRQANSGTVGASMVDDGASFNADGGASGTGTTGVVYGPDGTPYSSVAAAVAAGVSNYSFSKPATAATPNIGPASAAPNAPTAVAAPNQFNFGGGLISNASPQLFKQGTGARTNPFLFR